MNMPEILSNYVLPIAGPLLLAAGVLTWQRSQHFWSGRLAPKHWQIAAIVTGSAMLIAYILFVLPSSSLALRVVAALLIAQPAVIVVLVAWFARPRPGIANVHEWADRRRSSR